MEQNASGEVPLNAIGLPVANPVCVHEWARDNRRAVFICCKCQYEISDLDRHARRKD